MKIEFRAFAEADIPAMRTWLKEPHVSKFWQEPEDEAEFRNKYLKKLKDRGVCSFIIVLDGRPSGYIQSYQACEVGGGWWPNFGPGIYGIDQFIGDASLVGKGIGTMVISAFVKKLIQESQAVEVITDPDPTNIAAIRAYEKVGFVRAQEIQTPNGRALLMSLKTK